MNRRLEKLRQFMKEHRLDGVLVSKPENRFYFSGFSGSAGMLLITARETLLVTDFRYVEQAAKQAGLYQVLQYGGAKTVYAVLQELMTARQLRTVGFESDAVTYDVFHLFEQTFAQQVLSPVQLDPLRMVKDRGELALIKTAADMADQAFVHILSVLRPGISEVEVAVELEYKMRRLGSEKPAFDTIVASGVRGALPHGQPTAKLLETGDLVTMDFGAVYQGYHSDITRTVMIGQAGPEQKKIYRLVLAAQEAGLQAVKPGRSGRDIDEVARKVITEAGYGEYFGHGLGHGVGLAIHEEPRLSPAGAPVELAENMVVTVEPGIYIPGWGGVRIEDTVAVCAAGGKRYTVSSKQLIEIY